MRLRAFSRSLGLLVLSAAALSTSATEPEAGPTPYATMLACYGSEVTGGLAIPCKVWLNDTAARDVQLAVRLSGHDHDIAEAPPSVTIRAGDKSAAFQVNTRPVAKPTPLDIGIADAGQVLGTTKTLVPPALRALALAQTQVPGGAKTTGTILLTGRAPASGLTVHLLSSNTGVANVPSPIWIPADSNMATFDITSKPVQEDTEVTISAAMSDVRESTQLVIAREAKPDLLIYRWSFYDASGARVEKPAAGEAFSLCVNVMNRSYALAGETKLRVILMNSSGSLNLEWEKRLDPLDPGAQASQCIAMPALNRHHAYVFNMYADADENIKETDEANNYRAFQYRFADAPDAMAPVTLPPQPALGPVI